MSVRADILRFLRQPQVFAQSGIQASRDIWLQGLTDFAQPQILNRGDRPLRPAQIDAWEGLADYRAGLILGPPGTGKTYALSWMALGYLQARLAAGLPCRILVTAFTLNAIGNLLEAIQAKAARYLAHCPPIIFFGNPPEAGLPDSIEHVPLRRREDSADAWARLGEPYLIVGCSIWGLNRILMAGDGAATDGPTAPIFDLVCIDEASQMVVSQGLMALAGLAEGGRVLVAGDNKQLPPVRAVHEQEFDGRRLGGSLYDFLKSAQVAEFPLDETFRLNAPLTRFPEAKFYPGRYRSAEEVGAARLELRADWENGLKDWERMALSPDWPVCILLHDGTTAGTSNPLEVRMVTALVRRFHAAMLPGRNEAELTPHTFWQERLAVVSPHRAQNFAIRAALAGHPAAKEMVVETVDKIQGKERDAVIASYTVSDPEFALTEAEFIFSVERLNVTITRARTKLILLVSRRLLEVVPPDEETLDAAQILREFVFDSREAARIELTDREGRRVPVSVRVRGFTEDDPLPEIGGETATEEAEPLPELTRELQELLQAITELALKNPYGNVPYPSRDLKRRLYRDVAFGELRNLARLGYVRLEQHQGTHGPFWAARPLNPPQPPFNPDRDTVHQRLEEVIASARSGRLAPFYDRVRERFVWMNETGQDVLLPTLQGMAQDGLIVLNNQNGRITLDWNHAAEQVAAEAAELPTEALSDDDFVILNGLEDLEARRINFGIFEAWSSAAEVARELRLRREDVLDAMRRLRQHGHLLMDVEGRARSRMAELAREVRYVKQRFAVADADQRPFLVRALKVELRTRDKPQRNISLSQALDRLMAEVASDAPAVAALQGVREMLSRRWGQSDPALAGFQVRAMEQVLASWLGHAPHDAFVITADTGAGKTEAALLPLIAGMVRDLLMGVKGTRAVLVYPRIRLATNQAQRLAGYLAQLAQVEGMPTLTVGLQNKQVPGNLQRLDDHVAELWPPVGSNVLRFPLFGCPGCEGELHIHPGEGMAGADRLSCTCGWSYDGWVGSKVGLRARPPSFFLPVTESLHQWQQDARYGSLFGDLPGFSPPRAVLADEIHLYTHLHGAQVGYTLRRLLARAARNGNGVSPLAIGMSATLGDPIAVWRKLSGRREVRQLGPEASERVLNPRGREYFYFVQPEVESRGRDVAGASTSIQALMCLAHGMRRRTGREGGYRTVVFLDSIDKLKRLHSDYQDAEEGKRLAQLRTRLYDDDPGTGAPRRACCGQPASCDSFRDGECWYFAATDKAQITARGRYQPGLPLRVSDWPIFSGTGGRVEELIRGSDLVFATSSLEVGYDDPDISLVYQHYAPLNLASFIQRKGRGGRGADDRPLTGVTLSPYSPRDSWYFRRPWRMLNSDGFAVPLNLGNYFVVRGQVLAALLDAVARQRARGQGPGLIDTGSGTALHPAVLAEAESMIRTAFGDDVYRQLEVVDAGELWLQATREATGTLNAAMESRELRPVLPWIPRLLFEVVNLPELVVRFQDDDGKQAQTSESIALAMEAATPGNMTRRYGHALLHWVLPRQGPSPWLSGDVYRESAGFPLDRMGSGDTTTLLRELPLEARAEIGRDVHPVACRPGAVQLETAGRMRGAGWVPLWYYEPTTGAVCPIGEPPPPKGLTVHPKSRGSLRACTVIEADECYARPQTVRGVQQWLERLDAFHGSTSSGNRTGLSATRLVWGADAELRLEDPQRDDVPFSQVFVHPSSQKTLLHGYRVETEGIRLHLNSTHLTSFIESAKERLRDSPEGRWFRGQMLRYLIGSQARSGGINVYEAHRAADLLFSAAGHPTLRDRLQRLVKRWDSITLRDLLLDTYCEMLRQHPLLSERRVMLLAEKLAGRPFQQTFRSALDAIKSEAELARYLRSLLIHSIAVRMKQAFVLYGRGDERQVIVHAKLPVQFGADAADVISVVENGDQGDGTTRMFIQQLEHALEAWRGGGLAECPNASEDAVMEALFRQCDRHAAWRTMDPRNSQQMAKLARELNLDIESEEVSMQAVMRVLYGQESVGQERFDLYDLHSEIRVVSSTLKNTMAREPSVWELVSQVVNTASAQLGTTPRLSALLKAYERLEDATLEESLSSQARLADQVYRLSARLCIDGCQACLHSASGIVPESVHEASVSRTLLEKYVQDLNAT